MGIDAEKIWDSLRTKGLRVGAVALASALSFAIINKLAENSVSEGVDKIWALFDPPRFLLLFSEPVDLSRLSLLADGERPETGTRLNPKGDRAVELIVTPGYYVAVLHRSSPDGERILKEPINLRSNGTAIRIDASAARWALESSTQKFGSSNEGAANLLDTRWTSTQADWDVALSAGDRPRAAILRATISQIGVNERGSEADRATVEAYWGAIQSPDRVEGAPWGGAFLGWVMHQAGVTPPLQAASFLKWRDWGTGIPVDQAVPGSVGIFDFPGLPQAPSRLLVGVILRRKSECTEIIVGNIANRVVITCVAVPLKAVRGIGA